MLRFIFFGRRLRFIFFGRRLALQLPPPAAGADGGGSARRRLGAAPGAPRQGSGLTPSTSFTNSTGLWRYSLPKARNGLTSAFMFHIMHFLFFLETGGAWCLAGSAWRVVLGVWRFVHSVGVCVLFFSVGVRLCNCRPLPLALTGGVGAAGGCERRQAAVGRGQAAVGRRLALWQPKAYKVPVMHWMLNTTTIMLTSEWLIHSIYRPFRQKV